MDRGGIDICILSLVGPGIQGIPDASQAIAVARHANDHLAAQIAKNSKRLKGFAALPLQDPQAAAQELTRCVKDLGFCGAMVNGFTDTGDRTRFCSMTCRNIGIFGLLSSSSMCRSTSSPFASRRTILHTRATRG